jgi:hypothetical protein
LLALAQLVGAYTDYSILCKDKRQRNEKTPCEFQYSKRAFTQERSGKMDMIPSKKIAYRVENLTYSNAVNWFWRVEDLLEGKDVWAPVNDIINDRENLKHKEKDEDTKPKSLSESMAAKAGKAEWKKKNSEAKAIVTGLISEGDINIIRTRELEYAGDIWLYLESKYTGTTREMLTPTMRNFTLWKKSSAHSMEEAAQEIEAMAD